MEEHKNIFDFLANILGIFGISMIILSIFCRIFGKDAFGHSSIFQLGNKGVACDTIFQFLTFSVIMTVIQYILFSEKLVKKMSFISRIICMVLSDVVMVGVFSYKFLWFPIDEWIPWLMFAICFTVCFVISIFVVYLKEKADNKALAKALKKIQEEQDE